MKSINWFCAQVERRVEKVYGKEVHLVGTQIDKYLWSIASVKSNWDTGCVEQVRSCVVPVYGNAQEEIKLVAEVMA